MRWSNMLPPGGQVKLRSEASGGFVQIRPDGSIDARAGRYEPEVGFTDVFIVHHMPGDRVRFQNAANPGQWICIMTNDTLTGRGLGGEDCELTVDSRVNTLAFGSKFHNMWHLGFTADGFPKKPSECFLGKETEFVVVPAGGAPPQQPAYPPPAGMGMCIGMGMGMGMGGPAHHHPPHHPGCYPPCGSPQPVRLLRAVYGCFAEHHQMKDVTQVCQGLLTPTGTLNLGPSYNAHFGDPAPGIKKGLLLIWRNPAGLWSHVLTENEVPTANLQTPLGAKIE